MLYCIYCIYCKCLTFFRQWISWHFFVSRKNYVKILNKMLTSKYLVLLKSKNQIRILKLSTFSPFFEIFSSANSKSRYSSPRCISDSPKRFLLYQRNLTISLKISWVSVYFFNGTIFDSLLNYYILWRTRAKEFSSFLSQSKRNQLPIMRSLL